MKLNISLVELTVESAKIQKIPGVGGINPELIKYESPKGWEMLRGVAKVLDERLITSIHKKALEKQSQE